MSEAAKGKRAGRIAWHAVGFPAVVLVAIWLSQARRLALGVATVSGALWLVP